MTACAERLRLTEEYERLNRAYMALLELAEEAHTSPSADYIKLRTVATDARSDWEIARLEFLKHERTHLSRATPILRRWRRCDCAWVVGCRSNQYEVYVRPFPPGEEEWAISKREARWRADGKELFFIAADGKMMAVPVKAAPGVKPSLEAGVPLALFDAHAANDGVLDYEYDVTAGRDALPHQHHGRHGRGAGFDRGLALCDKDAVEVDGFDFDGFRHPEYNDITAVSLSQSRYTALRMNEPRGINRGLPDGFAEAHLADAHGIGDGLMHAQRGARWSLLASQNHAAIRLVTQEMGSAFS